MAKAPSSPSTPRRGLTRPLAELIRPAVGEALQAQGFAAADIVARWADIVGARLAARSMPLRILRSRARPGEEGPVPATLVLRVESAFAHEVEMAAAQILERVNATFGWRVVGTLRLRQGPVDRLDDGRRRPAAPSDPAQRQAVAAAVEGIDDEGLRAALERLGRAVLAERAAPRKP